MSTTSGWTDNNLSFANDPEDGEPVFFRFKGDGGGSILGANDGPVQLQTDGTDWHLDSTVWSETNNGERAGRATFVDYNTNSEVLDRPITGCFWEGGNQYRAFSGRDSVMNHYVQRNNGVIGDGIGEFSVVRGDGMRYVYGLPVYARDEVVMSYGLHGLSNQNIDSNFLAYKYVAPADYEENDNLNGSESPTPYATTFLLTEVVSPDYVDRTNNGPSPDDLGGYVVFNYKRKAGSFDKTDSDLSEWYKWRFPYRGTSYSRNSFSDPYDDAGTAQYGFKEVYYLASIETKTHQAVFHTSSRKDGYEAPTDESQASTNPAATAAGTTGNPKLDKLDKIETWSKDADGNQEKLLATTYFVYDYSLCVGTPNAESGEGKLTLKRVWFEYEGAINARISPYEFGYEYRPSSWFAGKGDISTRYASIVAYGDQWTSANQNPDYSPYDVDGWGNYQHKGHLRHDQFRTWVDQDPDQNFDPAAWQLKRIKLPSGGEIYVQYEQNDYRYVQHRDAMVMAPLKSRKSGPLGSDWYTFELDTDELGITSSADKTALVDALEKQFGDKDGAFTKEREYIYFRFLYGLIDTDIANEGPTPDPELCNVEYISGYAAVTGVEYDVPNDKVYIKIGDANEENSLPDKVCNEFVSAARDGIIQTDCGKPSDWSITDQGGDDEELASSAAYTLLQSKPNGHDDPVTETCRDINYAYSYLRIPAIKDKRGGGLRVKRLLTYDPGLEDEDVALYGAEYTYRRADGRSSGVAINEPASTREENALVHLGVSARAGVDSIVSGKGQRQLEEPLGESLLPAASVGYSRVIARDIHTGASSTGFAVYDFHTARDYPFDMRNGVQPDPGSLPFGTQETGVLTERSEPYPIDVVVYGNSSMYLNATQGYRFVLNNMHGQAKGLAQYIGDFDPADPHLDDAVMVGQTTYDYYQPWESIPVMSGPSMDDITYAWPGKTVELVTESREMVSDMSDVNIHADITLSLKLTFPIPFYSLQGRYQMDETSLRTHVATKVIEYPVILKSVSATQEGITSRTDYAGFDPVSGSPVLVKSYDGYNEVELNGNPPHEGIYYSVNIPAWQHYTQFGQMAETQNLVLESDLTGDNSGIAFDKRFIRQPSGDEHYLIVRTLKPGAAKKFLNSITTGDLIEITVNGTVKGVYNTGTIGANRVELLPVSYSYADTDQEVTDVTVEILKSGRNNRLGAAIGGFTTYRVAPQAVQN